MLIIILISIALLLQHVTVTPSSEIKTVFGAIVIHHLSYYIFKKNLNASKPSEHPPQVEECLEV